MIDEERTYSAGDMFINGDKNYHPKYILVHAGGQKMMLVRICRDSSTKWTIDDVDVIDAVTYDELRQGVGRFLEQMNNYDGQ